jgi:hypothetical protein
MNHDFARRLPWLVLVVVPFLAVADDAPLLVRIPLTGSPADVPLPVFAHLQQADAGEYVLAEATPAALKNAGLQYQFLDHLADGARYWLAEHPFGTTNQQASRDPLFRVLLDDGCRLLVRARNAEDLRSLVESGFELSGLERQPLIFNRKPPRLLAAQGVTAVGADPLVEELLGLVSTDRLVAAMDELTGPVPTVSDGAYAAIRTRHTAAGRPTQLATAYMYERFKALGLETSYHAWTFSSYANVNVVGVLPGTTAPSEIVVVCAHLDSMPSGAVAPGADDNASGSLAVLTAAELFRHYRFERTVRFILFTGEEQGLYGSRAYADAAAAAGDDIVAVLNLDMIAWDGNDDGLMQVHTRIVSSPGYAADRAIADVFTNVVATYALTNLVPSIRTSGVTYSDHFRFWNVGYPAILAIEDDGDFNPYYHTVNDVATHVNWPYFTSCVRAGIATIAHLAGPLDRRSFDAIRVVSGPFATNSLVGHGTFIARHMDGATESDDPGDIPDTGAPVGPFTSRLDLFSRPADSNLWVDARPAASETIYFASLRATHTEAMLTTTNRLRFDFVGVPDPDAAYLVRLAVAGQYLSSGIDHACVTNLRDVVAAGGFMDIPSSLRVTNGAIYGSCEVRRLRVSRKPQLAWDPSGVAGEPLLRIQGPPGLHVVDALEWSSTLTNWTAWATVTNRVAVDDLGFDSGERPLYPETPAPPPDETPRFYRLRRQWLSP